jgi:hypothetical protein
MSEGGKVLKFEDEEVDMGWRNFLGRGGEIWEFV